MELQRFRFPGNIRQLKNIAEQISVLEYDREIDGAKLRHYLPQDEVSSVPMLLPNSRSNDQNFSERDLLYKVLFDMKKDVTDLKKLVYEFISPQTNNASILQEHSHLFENLENIDRRSYSNPENTDNRLLPLNDHSDDYEKVEDIPHETEEETLSLESKEKEMILKALKKHNNKRKYAAHDLGISERTLYRKLKQYDIEEL